MLGGGWGGGHRRGRGRRGVDRGRALGTVGVYHNNVAALLRRVGIVRGLLILLVSAGEPGAYNRHNKQKNDDQNNRFYSSFIHSFIYPFL